MTFHRYNFDLDATPVHSLPFNRMHDWSRVVDNGRHPPRGWGGLRRFRDRTTAMARGGALLGLATLLLTSALAFGSLLSALVMAMLALHPPR